MIRKAALALLGASIALPILAIGGVANATPAAATYSFPSFGTVVVTGNVQTDERFSTYVVTGTPCDVAVGFNGTNCVPQAEVGTTVVIRAGKYKSQSFTTGTTLTCGANVQADVYTGPEIHTVGSAGHGAAFIAGGLLALPACVSPSPSPSPSPSASPSSSPSDTPSPSPSDTPSPSPSDTPTTTPTSTPLPSAVPSVTPSAPVSTPTVAPSPVASVAASVATLPFTGFPTKLAVGLGLLLLIVGAAFVARSAR